MVIAEKSNEAEITEPDALLQYKRVVDLHNLLGGDSNQTSVRGISDENERDHCGKKPMNTDASRGKKELKRLRVLRMAVIYMMMFVLNLYEFAKKNLGPLRSTVWTVEVAMITIVGPVYQRFKGVPDDFFALLDTKIDEAADKFDKHAPPLAKQVVYLTLGSIQKALKKTREFVNEAQAGGLHTAIHSAATEYKLLVFNQSMKFWVGLGYQCPPIHTVVAFSTPAAAYLSRKYNKVVRDLNLKGYTIFGYLPLVPIDQISTALNRRGREDRRGSYAC